MSRQPKNRNKVLARKIAKSAKSNRVHLAEGEKKSSYPNEQPKPHWAKATGKKGWWNTQKKSRNNHEEK